MGRYYSFILLILSLLPAAVTAVTIPDLYEAEVPLENAQPESLDNAYRTALGMVLIKLTGDRNAPGEKRA